MNPQIKSSKETESSQETKSSKELTPEERDEVMKYVLVLQRKWSETNEPTS